ncbi:iron complex outermembrane receptor protein [Ochrobactrum daejeonense]|uniref:Heme transporter BhuA n=1 Tax=Brucella daejeonensis TaxID=659015 RepID=A0A7W9EPP1_9HYPH|nr:TonB-dependent siderophore receptor [Brucella daejeonensis]MBB5704355.1 iron complex outermembrane receptor protein [Brucella daejeonensis]
MPVHSRIGRLHVALSCSALLASTAAVTAQENGQPLVLDTVTIQSESNEILVQDGYVAKKDRIGTKVDTDLVKIPQAISVITQDQMEDQKPITLNDALSYTASANPNNFGFDTRYDAFNLRGFPAYYNGMFRDGLRIINGPSAWLKTEPYGVEGITVLKGPASSLYGVSGPGGIVNVVTKRPKEDDFREAELLFGSHNRYQAAFDVSGPANDEKTFLYRITGLGRVSNTELPGYPDDKYYIAPALTLKPDEDTKFTVLGELSRSVTGGTAAFYNPSYGEVSDIYEGDPNYNDFVQKQGRIGYEFEHRFNDLLTVRQNLRYSKVDADLEYSGHYSIGLDQPLQRYWGHYTEKMDNFVVDTMAQFDFETGSLTHKAIAGIDYARSDYDAYSGLSYVSANDMRAQQAPFSGGQKMNQIGVYAHDQVEWDDFILFGSGRYDWVDTRTTDTSFIETRQKDSGFSGRVGLAYRTEWGIIPYVNYSTSFSPNIGFVYDDVMSDDKHVANPTIGRQKEIGVKYEIPGYNAVISAAFFDIDQKDGIVLDASSGINKQRQLDLNSRGFELEANATLDNGIGLIASYTHLRVKIEDGASGTVGNELSGTPNDVFSIWGNYKIENGALAGLGLGSGIRYVSSSYGDDQNSFKNDSRVMVDAAVSYDFGYRNPKLDGVLLQINAKNIFDNRDPVCTAGYCYQQEGRQVFGSLRYRF